jgi:hypothetical protein
MGISPFSGPDPRGRLIRVVVYVIIDNREDKSNADWEIL